jgi:hypothetical protein
LHYIIMHGIAGRDNSVAIVTEYGLDGPGSESRWVRGFPQPSRLSLGPPASYAMSIGSFPAVNRSERGVDYPPHLMPSLRKEKNWTFSLLLDRHGLLWGEI